MDATILHSRFTSHDSRIGYAVEIKKVGVQNFEPLLFLFQYGQCLGKKLDTIIDKRIHLLAFQHTLVEFGQAQ